MNKKVSLGVTISIAAIAAAITFILTMTFSMDVFNTKVQGLSEREEMYNKLEKLDNLVRSKYVGAIDEKSLLDGIAAGYVSGLNDKYAHYYSIDDYEDQKLGSDGYTVGIGVTVTKEESGYISVVSVTNGSPAAEAGILVGDVIVGVDGEDVLALGYDAAVKRVRGVEGTTVSIVVRREGEDTSLNVARKKIDIVSSYGEMIEGDVGYVRITEFNGATPTQFETAVSDLIQQGAKAFLFDVRDNRGGTVNSVAEILDYLLPKGVLATAVYKDGTETVLHESDEERQLDLPMTILVNGNTASAAELFAAAIRDFDKGELVGETTYGKGVMQETYSLEDGSGVTITVAQYNPPKSGNYDGVGLKPDYEAASPASLSESSPDKQTDPQFKKGLEVLRAAMAD